MPYKEHTFEDLPAPDITLELYYNYSYTPGRYFGLPENCYPEEEESELSLPDGWEEQVISAYMTAAREAMKQIEQKVIEMRDDGLPREWAEQEKRY